MYTSNRLVGSAAPRPGAYAGGSGEFGLGLRGGQRSPARARAARARRIGWLSGARRDAVEAGAIEGACRHLIGDRLDSHGARWGLHDAEDVLELRALHDNGDFDEYWTFHLVREHARLYPTPDRRNCRLTLDLRIFQSWSCNTHPV